MDEKPRSHSYDAGAAPRAVVLVEGFSDQCAVEALAERRGRDLHSERISVVPIGGAQAIGQFLNLFGPRGLDVRLAGICDAGEEGDFRRGLERAGLGSRLSRDDMERLGFFVCTADLQDELIRALGAASVERVIEAEGDLGSFRTLQSSRSGEVARRSSSFGASWAAGAAERSGTHGCSSMRWIPLRCRGRSTRRLLTSDPHVLDCRCAEGALRLPCR